MKTDYTYYPNFSEAESDEIYSGRLSTEYIQCIDEGLEAKEFRDLFLSIEKMPCSPLKEEFADTAYKLVSQLKIRADYKYKEPSDSEGIFLLSDKFTCTGYDNHNLYNKVKGAWYGRVIGCLLGKTLEGIRNDELQPFLKETGNLPMHRYVLSSDINEAISDRYKYSFRHKCYADKIDYMPVDDDTNYTVFYQHIIEKYGRDFTASDVAGEWLKNQTYDTYFTAERVAYFNFINGFKPPFSAVYKNPFREWIGAQIRGDYFGYINPGNPKAAADMAFRDASISHTKNGIYGEMLVSAMIACAYSENDPKRIIECGLSYIPTTSRLYEAIKNIISIYSDGKTYEECKKYIHSVFDDHLSHHWCHTISNSMIVAAALLYGDGDFSSSICKAVEMGFDTDCNGATVGSVVGIINGYDKIDKKWIVNFNDTIETYMQYNKKVKISDCIDMTMKHIG